MRTCFQLIGILLSLAVAGCTTYAPVPLPQNVDLSPSLPAGTPPTLDLNSVAAVALINNPDLKAQREKAKVSDAEAYSAGILPNPQLDGNLDLPTNQGPEAGTGIGFGLSYDIQALITRPARLASANAARDQAQLDLLWQEWQTVAQARLLYTERINAGEKQTLYAAISDQYAAQSMRTSQALQRGDVTFDESGVDLAALLDSQSQLTAAERAASQADYSLRTLLGVTPQVAVPLQSINSPAVPDRAAVEAALAKVAQVRPDLRALQAGYQSQEQSVREAVLAQFPSLSLGISRQTDTPGDRTGVDRTLHFVSLGATLNLPLFDRNQGVIAVQRATRAQLRAEYQARLDQATGDAWRLWAEMQELDRAMKDVEARLPDLQAGADNAQRAYLAGNLPALTYVTLEGALVTRQAELSDYKQALWADMIALSSVIGTQVEPDVEAKGAMQ